MGIDDLADRFRGGRSPGLKFKEEFLAARPEGQWAPYIDNTALCVADKIGIGSTGLDPFNFGEEVGEFYTAGLEAASGSLGGEQTYGKLSDKEVGKLVYALNELNNEIKKADGNIENIGSALNALVQKLVITQDIALTYQSEVFSETVADLLITLLDDPAAADELPDVVAAIESTKTSLLKELDRPQMVTPLWTHQQDALRKWLEADCRGFVDMATATGKTVLGLATIALRYGSLHQDDIVYLNEQGIDAEDFSATKRENILIVAHNNFILEQWKRELDRHLCIPPARTEQDDESVVQLTWGNVHFRTPQGLDPEDIAMHDLVIFDEAHHYANSKGWGQLLRECENDVLALSGSVDAGGDDEQSAVRNRLERYVGAMVKEYTSAQAQTDGITPKFEWSVYFTEFENEGDDLLETTATVKDEWDQFVQRIEAGNVPLDIDRSLATHKSVRTVAQLFEEGRKAKSQDKQFRDLATALSSRHMLLMNRAPSIDAVVELATEHSNEKVVILTRKRSEAEVIVERLRSEGAFPESAIKHVTADQSRKEQNAEVENYDLCDTAAVLVGTGSQIGEGADIKSATVGINISKGAVNRSLIQRIGRVLRNPNGNKEALFYNVVGVPTDPEARIPGEDGLDLLEDIAQYLTYGDSLDETPAFIASSSVVQDSLTMLEREGCKRLVELQQKDEYTSLTEESDPQAYDNLCTLRDFISERKNSDTGSAVLSKWHRNVERREMGVQTAGDEPMVIDGTRSSQGETAQEPAPTTSGIEAGEEEESNVERSSVDPETASKQQTMQTEPTNSQKEGPVNETTITIDGALAALVDRAIQMDTNEYETRGELAADALEEFVGPVLRGQRESLSREVTQSRTTEITADPITSKLLQLHVENDDSYSTQAAFVQDIINETLGIEDTTVNISIPNYTRYEFVVDQLLQSDDCPYEDISHLVQAALEANLGVQAPPQ